ncbi:hypothetical protein KIW84_061104 [Lathyrus oleraceus]|uniref:Uncharacterized protein n=1 Tax=Pisum sativum TaxID=3888 RepID=A0A9D5A4Q1_PEA|nr:hypothetical protein KIW84_061104 [Pisum sativum]
MVRLALRRFHDRRRAPLGHHEAARIDHEGGTLVRLLSENMDVVKVLTNEMSIEALVQFKEVRRLEQSLKRARIPLEILEERVSLLKDEVVAIFVHHFERVRRHVTLIYPAMDLILMDPSQVVRDGQLVDDE